MGGIQTDQLSLIRNMFLPRQVKLLAGWNHEKKRKIARSHVL